MQKNSKKCFLYTCFSSSQASQKRMFSSLYSECKNSLNTRCPPKISNPNFKTLLKKYLVTKCHNNNIKKRKYGYITIQIQIKNLCDSSTMLMSEDVSMMDQLWIHTNYIKHVHCTFYLSVTINPSKESRLPPR